MSSADAGLIQHGSAQQCNRDTAGTADLEQVAVGSGGQACAVATYTAVELVEDAVVLVQIAQLQASTVNIVSVASGINTQRLAQAISLLIVCDGCSMAHADDRAIQVQITGLQDATSWQSGQASYSQQHVTKALASHSVRRVLTGSLGCGISPGSSGSRARGRWPRAWTPC